MSSKNTKSKKMLCVYVDTNDADFDTFLNEITDEQLVKFQPLFDAINKFEPYDTVTSGTDPLKWTHRHNWPYSEYSPREDLGEKSPQELYADGKNVTEDLVEEFIEDFLGCCHSILEIRVLTIVEDKQLVVNQGYAQSGWVKNEM